jgi:hypothetical protein
VASAYSLTDIKPPGAVSVRPWHVNNGGDCREGEDVEVLAKGDPVVLSERPARSSESLRTGVL